MKGVINQGQLEKVVHQIFPTENIISNARDEAQIKNKLSDHYFEVDLWIPSMNLGFEFQDDYHYITTWYYHRTHDSIAKRDTLKKETVLRGGLTLIQIPCWWDGRNNSLQATLNFERPDLALMSTPCHPIPLNPHPSFFSVWRVPGVGELMSPSFSTSTSDFGERVSVFNSWWLGEKYDGIRACWNSISKVLYSRIGRDTNLPQQFNMLMPPVFFECELWFGRGCFADAVQLYSSNKTNLQHLRLVAFDKPELESQKLSFEKRYEALLRRLPSDHPFVVNAMRVLCTNTYLLQQNINKIISDGGEGVILRKCKSKYVCGRSDLLWKLKTQREDTEALVVHEEEDSTFILQLPNGVTFRAPPFTPPPKKGEVVTFLFDNFTNQSIPANPQIFRVRPDLEWVDVLREFHAQKRQQESPEAIPFTSKPPEPPAFWNPKNRKNVKQFLESFAKRKNMDPLLASTWYAISDDLRKQKEMKAIVSHYGDYLKALRAVFPQVAFDDFQFTSLPKNYWGSVDNRYNYLVHYAEKVGLDPLKAGDWYSLSLDNVLREKEINAVISYYDYSLKKALLHLFPNIGFDKGRLAPLSENPFSKKYQKKAMIQLAQEKGFDPVIPENWYQFDFQSISKIVNMQFVDRLYQGNFSTALLSIFPDIGLERKRFDRQRKTYDIRQQREFFNDFATENEFDPIKPGNWYKVEKESILAKKNGYAILSIYNNSLASALCSAYPDIGLIRSAFTSRARRHKEFFDEYARQRAFDPLVAENWYSITKSDVLKSKDGRAFLGFYHDSLVSALLDVYPQIDLKPNRFDGKKTGIYWSNLESRKKFFDDVARGMNLDPLLPASWYSLKRSAVTSQKDGISVLKYHNMSVRQALLDIYPNIDLNKNRFLYL